MNKTHQKTLKAIFQQPVPVSLEWRKIEGTGSRVRFQKEAKPYQVRDARMFLEKAGVLL